MRLDDLLVKQTARVGFNNFHRCVSQAVVDHNQLLTVRPCLVGQRIKLDSDGFCAVETQKNDA